MQAKTEAKTIRNRSGKPRRVVSPGPTRPEACTRGSKRAAGDWRDRFLAALWRCGSIKTAAKAAGIGKSTVYDRLSRDEAFREQVTICRWIILDELLSQVFRGGMAGGDDRMLELLAQLTMPDRYGPPPGGGAIDTNHPTGRDIARVANELASIRGVKSWQIVRHAAMMAASAAPDAD